MFADAKLISFTSISMMICWLIFIIMKIYEFINDTAFSCVLHSFGGNYGPDLTFKYQFYRLITPIFLHANFAHIFFNTLGILSFGFSNE